MFAEIASADVELITDVADVALVDAVVVGEVIAGVVLGCEGLAGEDCGTVEGVSLLTGEPVSPVLLLDIGDVSEVPLGAS